MTHAMDGYGAFDDVPIMDVPIHGNNGNNGNINHNSQYLDDSDFNDIYAIQPNTKKKTTVKKKIETLEGYTLEKAKVDRGGVPTWDKVKTQKQPFHEDQYADIAKKNVAKHGKSNIKEQFDQLSRTQRARVSELVEDRKARETLKNADWTLYDVYKKQRPGGLMSKPETTEIQVILRRFDINSPNGSLNKTGGKNGGAATKSKLKDTDPFDLMFDVPPKTKKANKQKALKKHNSYDDLRDILPMPGLGPDPMLQNHPQPQRHNSQVQQQHPDYFPEPLPHPQQNQHPPFPVAPPPPLQQPYPTDFNNPFIPHDRALLPHPDYDGPPDLTPWPLPHHHPLPSARRRKSSSTRRRLREVEEELANLRLDAQVVPDAYSPPSTPSESVFDRGASPTRSFTPPSSPGRAFEVPVRRDSRRRSTTGFPGMSSHSRYRHQRHGSFVDVEPAYSNYSRGDQLVRSGRRGSTYDDYLDRDRERDRDYRGGGGSRVTEYIRAPEAPRPRVVQRRLTDGFAYDDDRRRVEDERRRYDDERRRDGRYEDKRRRFEDDRRRGYGERERYGEEVVYEVEGGRRRRYND